MPFPSHFPKHAAIQLRKWAVGNGNAKLDLLLDLRSARDDPAEPPWLALCSMLRHPDQVSGHEGAGLRAIDGDLAALGTLASVVRRKDTLLADMFDPKLAPNVFEQQAQQRALAMARWALPAEDVNAPADAQDLHPLSKMITPLELKLLDRHLAGEGLEPAPGCALTMTVLLVAPEAPVGTRGRLAHLYLWRLPDALVANGTCQGDGLAVADEVLVRAPQALLLALDAPFRQGLAQVAALLRACLPAPRPALAWSLKPLPMAGEHAAVPWGARAVAGASATVAFALGALHCVRWRLDTEQPAMADAQRRLHRLQPQRVAVTAMLDTNARHAPGAQSLDWVLAHIEGLNDKLDAFHDYRYDKALQVNRADPPDLSLVAETQVVPGDPLEVPKKAATLALLLKEADGHQNPPPPEPQAELHQALLAEELPPTLLTALRASEPPARLRQSDAEAPTSALVHRADTAIDPGSWPPVPQLPAALLGPARRDPPSGARLPQSGSTGALEQHLLQRLALWAGGHHLQFHGDGDPVRLGDEFTDIAIRPDESSDLVRRWKDEGWTDDQVQDALHAGGLAALLHHDGRFDGVDAWLLTAPPAAGKTTLLAEYEMRTAWRALRRFAATGCWGEVAVWVPLRQLQVLDDKGQLRPVADMLYDWLAEQPAPLALQWRHLFEGPLATQQGLRVVPLFDGANELRCNPDQRGDVLEELLRASRSPRGAHHATPVVTVRTLDAGFSLAGQCQAHLLPWGKVQRERYVHRRLGADSDAATKLLQLVEADIEPDDSRRFYANPGLLAIACSLMQQGWLPELGTNRAQLYATLVWTRLHREVVQKKAADAAHLVYPGDAAAAPPDWRRLLNAEEHQALQTLAQRLADGEWGFPEPSGPLLEALRQQALGMQGLSQPNESLRAMPGVYALQAVKLDAPEAEFFPALPPEDRKALLRAAHAVQLLDEERRADPKRTHAKGPHWRWRHQTLLEFFAAWSLRPDGPLPDLRIPPGVDLEQDYRRHQAAERERRALVERNGGWFYAPKYRLPQATASIYEQPVLMAAQLNGDAVQWVEVLLERSNPELAARVALENWGAFGERRDHPQDGWWTEGTEYDEGGSLVMDGDGHALAQRRTHRWLNRVREALLKRMNDPDVHISSRIDSGFLLGELGGDGRFAICGQALVLKDEYWQRVPVRGTGLSFQLGDLEGLDNQRTAAGHLLQVDDLPAFEMAGLLTTQAQMRCFIQGGGAENLSWWPGAAGVWRRQNRSWTPWWSGNKAWSNGTQPAMYPFWFAQAYALWESAQRRAASEPKARDTGIPLVEGVAPRPVQLPTEAQWGAAVRCGQPAEGEHWRFGHTLGKPVTEGEDFDFYKDLPFYDVLFEDVRLWHFNHDHVFGRTTPVGVFIDSAVGPECDARQRKLRDLAGNSYEWTASKYTPWLELAAVRAVAEDDVERGQVGGSYASPAANCASGVRRDYDLELSIDEDEHGFRLVRMASD